MKNLVKLKVFNKILYITNNEADLLIKSVNSSRESYCYINNKRYIVSNFLLNQILNGPSINSSR